MSSSTTSTRRASSSRLLTDAEVAERLNIGRTTARRLRYDGHLPTVHIGSAVRVPSSAVDDYISNQLTDQT